MLHIQVLPPYSATMGVVHETILPRQENHEDLATFSNDDDPVFLNIVEAITSGELSNQR